MNDSQKEDIDFLACENDMLQILQNYSIMIGASVMIGLLVNNAQASRGDKIEWLKDLSAAWDFYKNKGKDNG